MARTVTGRAEEHSALVPLARFVAELRWDRIPEAARHELPGVADDGPPRVLPRVDRKMGQGQCLVSSDGSPASFS